MNTTHLRTKAMRMLDKYKRDNKEYFVAYSEEEVEELDRLHPSALIIHLVRYADRQVS